MGVLCMALLVICCLTLVPASRVWVELDVHSKQLESNETKESNETNDWLSTFNRLGGDVSDAIGNQWSKWRPKRGYRCKADTKYGSLDRWVSVQPDIQSKGWLNPKEWKSWLEKQLGLVDEEKQDFSFQPFILRNRTEYINRTLVKVVTTSTSSEPCISTYMASCPGKQLRLIETKSCGEKPITTKNLLLGSISSTGSFCSYGPQSSYPFGPKWAQSVLVMDTTGQWQPVAKGQCVAISAVDPASGISLSDLDSDMLGNGLDNLGGNATKVERIVHQLNNTLQGIYDALVAKGGEFVEGGTDALQVGNALQNDIRNGSDLAVSTSVKWIKKLTLSSMVETCLCCDMEAVANSKTMSAHCKVAYTLGGQNKSDHLNYALKTTAGTLYNLAQTAGGWVVPLLGGNIVKKAHEQACRFSCDMRQPHLYEAYAFGQVRMVPGLALQTWFIPNPSRFFKSATSKAVDTAVQNTANNVVGEVVEDVVDDVV